MHMILGRSRMHWHSILVPLTRIVRSTGPKQFIPVSDTAAEADKVGHRLLHLVGTRRHGETWGASDEVPRIPSAWIRFIAIIRIGPRN